MGREFDPIRACYEPPVAHNVLRGTLFCVVYSVSLYESVSYSLDTNMDGLHMIRPVETNKKGVVIIKWKGKGALHAYHQA